MEEARVLNQTAGELVDLPLGFRFHPTDEEIITYYLTHKVINGGFTAIAIGEADLNKCEPWDLPQKSKIGESEWYFFCQRDRKYPTGMRTNRATESGYWKATGKDKEIYRNKSRILVGMKKTLVFYTGRAPKGEKTNWVMHEYRLHGNGKSPCHRLPHSATNDWVVCRIFHKNVSTAVRNVQITEFPSLPPLMDPSGGSHGRDESYYLKYFSGEMKQETTSTSYYEETDGRMISIDQNWRNSEIFHRRLGQVPADSYRKTVEQFPVTSVSQDTGLSSEVNNAAEISSINGGSGGTRMLENECILYQDLEMDLWDY